MAARMKLTVLLLFCALAGAAAAVALSGIGNPRGQWATPKQVKAALLASPPDVLHCPANCYIDQQGLPHGYDELPFLIRSITVNGLGRSKLLAGARRWQLFEVTACGLDAASGGTMASIHFRWFTRRPPYQAPTTTHADGTASSYWDGGQPYATDWTNPGVSPIAVPYC